MAFEAVLGQDAAIRFLRRVVEHGRLPSAFLFLGPHHVGKRMTALMLAKALNCENPPFGVDGCDRCPSCRKVDAQVHPDILMVSPDGQFIKIDQVREVGEQLALNPLLARKRVVIVTEAERMNPQSANAFLKTLEEPPADTLLVLCAEDAAQLLPTIVSRCVPVRFHPLSMQVLRRLLAAQEAPGAPSDPGAEEFAVRFCQGRMLPGLRTRLPGWLAIREDLLQAFRFPETAFAAGLGDKLARWSQSGEWSFVLEWLETWFRDLALFGAGAGAAHLINVDRQDDLRAAASLLDTEAAAQCYRAVLAARNAIELNANKPLALEALWLQFRRHDPATQGMGSP
jgi:DNA polymerase-3 subunit delta'